jgi:gliding motility-associated-like protein
LVLDAEEVRDVSCDWVDNGAITVRAIGATEPVTYTFNGADVGSESSFTMLPVGTHILTVTDAAGCYQEREVNLGYDYSNPGEDCPCFVYVPSAFSPDGDNLNEILRIEASCPISDVHLQILNRWGDIVHESQGLETPWNGGVAGYYVAEGVYQYRLTYKWGEAGNATGTPELAQGSIAIIR